MISVSAESVYGFMVYAAVVCLWKPQTNTAGMCLIIAFIVVCAVSTHSTKLRRRVTQTLAGTSRLGGVASLRLRRTSLTGC